MERFWAFDGAPQMFSTDLSLRGQKNLRDLLLE